MPRRDVGRCRLGECEVLVVLMSTCLLQVTPPTREHIELVITVTLAVYRAVFDVGVVSLAGRALT